MVFTASFYVLAFKSFNEKHNFLNLFPAGNIKNERVRVNRNLNMSHVLHALAKCEWHQINVGFIHRRISSKNNSYIREKFSLPFLEPIARQ